MLKTLAVAAPLACATAALALPPLEKPQRVRFQLADGIRVSGEMTSCDDEGFDGSFGRRLWTELDPGDAWTLHQRVMDSQSAADWINLGRIMLLMSSPQSKAGDRARERSDTAFRKALQIDPESQVEIERVQDEVARLKQAARDAKREAEAQKLSTISPEGAGWRPDAWPVLSDDEQASAVLAMKADGENILKQASAAITPVETAHFLVYGETDRAEAADWAMRLERVLLALEFVLNPGVDPASKKKDVRILPWGKVDVFIWKERDRFRMVEAESFRHLVPGAAVAVAHFTGPKAFINAWRESDDELFEWAMQTEAVHALLHRCGTPQRLPAWANEGLAELIASRANKYSSVGRDRRRAALEFIRAGGDVNAILDRRYDDGSWPGPDAIAPAVGGLMIELMLNEKPQRLQKWILAVKAGKDWQQALKEDYGTTREDIVAVSTQFYKVND